MAINQNDYHYWRGSFKGLLPNGILKLSDKDFQMLYEEFINVGIDSSYLEELIEDIGEEYDENYLEGRVLRNVFKEFLDDLGYSDIYNSSKEIDLFRSISVNRIEEIKFDDIGVCWTYSSDNLDFIENNIIPDNIYLTRFYGTTPIENVDWVESLFLYINYYSQEKELRVYNSNKVFLKGYINIDYSTMVEYSSYGKISYLLFGVTTKEELLKIKDSILNGYNPITKRYDYSGSLSRKDLKYFVSEDGNGFTINFGVIKGSFNCSKLGLTSLKGAPQEVSDSFNCSNNQLTSLKGAPQEVSDSFNCSNNQLTSLEGAPQEVSGNFYCHENQLISLKGAPQTIGGSFYCDNNKLTSLEGAPKEVGKGFYCHSNILTSLKGAPREVGWNFNCFINKLTSLKGAPKKVGGSFDCSYNSLTSLEGAPREVSGHFDCYNNQLTSLKGAPQEVSGRFACQSNPNLHSLEGIGEVRGDIYKDF